ncbi:MAG: hypothetical protein ABSD56_11935 [Bryobacteraceae bacterium]
MLTDSAHCRAWSPFLGLQRLCAELERQVLTSLGFGSYEAAEELSHIKDPVAVPFLARLLQARDKLAPALATGLARMFHQQSAAARDRAASTALRSAGVLDP